MNRRDTGIVERQVDAMLHLLRRHQTTAAAAILDRAHEVAAERVRTARANARRRVHEAAEGLRAEVDVRLTRLRAGEQAEERERRLARDELALAEGMELLRVALLERWAETERRRGWWRAMVEAAGAVLPATAWEVAHPGDLPADEREELAAAIAEATGQKPRLAAADEVSAGIRIAAGDAVFDGTVSGLLARQSELEARLLAHFHALLDHAAVGGRP